MTTKLLPCILSFCLTGLLSAQNMPNNLPTIPTVPKPSLLPPNSSSFGTSPSQQLPQQSEITRRSQEQVRQHQQIRQQERMRQQQLEMVLEEDAKEAVERERYFANRTRPIYYDFSSKQGLAGTEHYRSAFGKLLKMDSSFSITKAVFTTENAFFDNRENFSEIEAAMRHIASFLTSQMKKEGQNVNNNLAKNLMIYRFFADTMAMENGKYHLPIQYDFNDYMGNEDFRNTMVLKVLRQNSGQCHSLPLLYLMIAEYMGAEAYLVNSPNHTYIKFPLPTGGYQNIELTSHRFTTDVNVVASGYIKAEAMQSKIYMQPLNDRQLLSDNIADLAKSFMERFGRSPFMMEMLDSALALDPNNITALLMKSNYLTYQFIGIERQLVERQVTKEAFLRDYPKAVAILDERNAVYDQIDALGYEAMPSEAYESWLKGMEQEISRRENENTYLKLKNILD